MIPQLKNPLIEKFRNLEEGFLHLAVSGRFDELLALLDKQFTAISYHGLVFNLETYTEVLRTRTRYNAATLGPIDVFQEGPVTVVTGHMTLDYVRDDFLLMVPVRFTRIWVQRTEGWRLLHSHVSDARLGEAWSKAKEKTRPDIAASPTSAASATPPASAGPASP